MAWLGTWLLVAAFGAGWLAHARLGELQAAFETDARIVHRLLSQQMVQNDAVMATLVLLQPSPDGSAAAAQRLPSVYPRILSALTQPEGSSWPAALATSLASAQAASRQLGRPQLARTDLDAGRYWLVQAGDPVSYALLLDLQATVPWSEWPMDAKTSPVRVVLEHEGQSLVLQAGSIPARGWRFDFRKTLASPSQPFDVLAERVVAWGELPWLAMLTWVLGSAATLAAARLLWRQREARLRAEHLLRLGQVARLNTLGELAAGMAHELNQPLTALLASTQAAQRLLGDTPPDLDTARTAMAQSVQQARRAADVVGRLRRLVERPDLAGHAQAVALPAAVQEALHLLAPELTRRGVASEVDVAPDLPLALAEPIALQQIIHNLLTNAMQALEQVPAPRRVVQLGLRTAAGGQVLLSVRDHGPGLSGEARTRLFEPFYSSRADGLGLGLPLCESLAEAMGGHLSLGPELADGAEFLLLLPAAQPLP